jgi:integrase
VPSPRAILAALDGVDRAVRWFLVGKLGRIRGRVRGSQREFYLDFRPYGRVWSNRGILITDEDTARRLLERIRGEVAEDRTLEEVLASYMPVEAKPNRVPVWLERWLDIRRREAAGGTLSPGYVRELEHMAEPEGHFSFFREHSIHEISYGVLEDWSLWLADRKLSPKTRRNLLASFRAFLVWLHRRGEIRNVPEFPSVKVEEHEPRIIGVIDQDRVLEAIPERDRGIFVAMAYMGLRPGEARALTIADCHDGWLKVDKAIKGKSVSAPVRGTKTGKPKSLPMPEVLQAWIGQHVDRSGRLSRQPLFPNPRTGRPWAHKALQRIWNDAVESAGLPHISLYEGTKHSMATDAMRRGVSERALQRFLGHTSVQSTRRYARLADNALLEVLRSPSAVWRQVGDKEFCNEPERNQTVSGGPSRTRTCRDSKK